jgi:hypothetical protein
MISTTPSEVQPINRLLNWLRHSWGINMPLTVLSVGCLIVAVLGVFGLLADPRQVLGQPVWAKTTKFAISLALFGASMTWMLGFLKSRASRIAGNIIGTIMSLEMLLIITQAIRGRAMHFNVATPFDLALWDAMSLGIQFFFIAFIVAIILLFRLKLESKVLLWSLRLGLIVIMLGFAQGSLMTSANPLQQAALDAGQELDLIGAHTVGVLQDGGPGVPFLGWSTDHGDLRIGHFVGVHGVQVIPLLGVFLMRRRQRWLSESHRVGLVFIAALGYLGLVSLVTWQALRDQSIISPDAVTFQVLLGIVTAVLILGLIVIAHAKRTVIN